MKRRNAAYIELEAKRDQEDDFKGGDLVFLSS